MTDYWTLLTQPVSIAVIVAVGAFVARYFFDSKRKDARKVLMGVSVIALIVGGLLFVGGDTTALTQNLPPGAASAQAIPISSFRGVVQEAGSGQYNQVNGRIDFYSAKTDLLDPDATPIFSAGVSSGVLSGSNVAGISTNTPYKVVYYDNSSTQTWYPLMLLNNQVLPDDLYDPQQGLYELTQLVADKQGIVKIATLADILDETKLDGTINGESNLSVNSGNEIIGDTNATAATADATLVYDESDGDGEFYLDLTHSVSGANTKAKGYGFCFEGESTTVKPEGDEFSSITVSTQSGSGFNWGKSDLANVFADLGCVSAGDITSSKTQKDRLTFAVNEANLDTNDDFTIVRDDQIEEATNMRSGQTASFIRGQYGAAVDVSVDFDAQA